MEQLTLQDLITATSGVLVGSCQDLSQTFSAVDTDSRTITTDSVFFSLLGEHFDGHRFLGDLETSCVSGFVISQELTHYATDKFYVKVSDSKKALGDLAKYYRNRFHLPVIAVTGSVGKTTAKDMISSVLSTKYKVLKTEGNFNNEIGLPLTLFRLTQEHEVCVLEMGMDALGDIDYLGNIASPCIAVITNIGDAHVERLGSRENILKAKCEILNHLPSDGLVLLNGDDSLLKNVGRPYSFQTVLVGFQDSFPYYATQVENDGVSSTFCKLVCSAETIPVCIPALGKHMVYPSLFALGIGKKLNLSTQEVVDGISNFIPTKMRMNQVKLKNSVTLLDDTYNANPQSMKASIEVLSNFSSEKKIAVLGDMFELGEFSESLHQEVGRFVAQQGIDILIAVGTLAVHFSTGAKEGNHPQVYSFLKKEEAVSLISSLIAPNTTILFKASRGMGLETLVEEVKNIQK